LSSDQHATIFPAVSTVLSADAISERILPLYELTPPVRCRLLSRGLNDTYRVSTGDGDRYLRVYRHGWRSTSACDAELQVMLELRRAGLEVSVPVPRTDGSLLTVVSAAEGDRQIALFTPAEGEDVREITTRHARAYGRLAARLHEIIDASTVAYDRPTLDETHLIDEPMRAITAWASQLPDCSGDLEFLTRVAGVARERIATLERASPGFGMCHGDLHPGNVRFGDRLQPTLFDFDCCGYGLRSYDMTVFYWNSFLEQRSSNWQDSRWDAFLKGYGEIRSVPEDLHENLPFFLVARHIWLMGLDCSGQSDWLPQWLTPDWFSSMIGHIRRWTLYYPSLGERGHIVTPPRT
jgi:Ser/Thr protein kinase RdoA (MazF antagonist)